MRYVEVGVEAQLSETAADPSNRLQQLVARSAKARVNALRRTEQLLSTRLPFRAQRAPGLLGERRWRLRRARARALDVGEHESCARAGHGHVHQPAHLCNMGVARICRQLLGEQRIGDRLDRTGARSGDPRRLQAKHEDALELVSGRSRHRHHAHPAGSPLAVVAIVAILQSGLGDRRHVAGKLPRCRLGRAPHEGRSQLGEAREADQPLDDVGLGGEELLAADAETLDQAVDKEVRARGVERRCRRTVQLEKPQHPLTRFRGQLRRLRRGRQGRDHVQLSPPRDLRAAGEVDRSQLDRWPRQSPHGGTRVGRVHE